MYGIQGVRKVPQSREDGQHTDGKQHPQASGRDAGLPDRAEREQPRGVTAGCQQEEKRGRSGATIRDEDAEGEGDDGPDERTAHAGLIGGATRSLREAEITR